MVRRVDPALPVCGHIHRSWSPPPLSAQSLIFGSFRQYVGTFAQALSLMSPSRTPRVAEEVDATVRDGRRPDEAPVDQTVEDGEALVRVADVDVGDMEDALPVGAQVDRREDGLEGRSSGT
jgi:hypothetical protein